MVQARPNQDPENAEAIRQPKTIVVMGWLVAPIGLLLIPCAVSGSVDAEDQMPMFTCGIALFPAAALLVAGYVYWYVILRDDQVIQRTAARQLRTIRYGNIAKCRKFRDGAASMLRLRGYDGVVIKFNAAANASPVLAALERRQIPGA